MWWVSNFRSRVPNPIVSILLCGRHKHSIHDGLALNADRVRLLLPTFFSEVVLESLDGADTRERGFPLDSHRKPSERIEDEADTEYATIVGGPCDQRVNVMGAFDFLSIATTSWPRS